MTKLKISSRFRIFLIISLAIIVIGMALGTVGQFVWNGFFNYGDEFAPYKSVVVRYSSAEYTEDNVKPVCEKELSGLGAYGVSFSETLRGGEIIYKFDYSTDTAKLEEAAGKINASLNTLEGEGLADLNVASVRVGKIGAGGSRALIFAAVATSSAVAFAFIYYIFRYKLRSACTALLACLHNLGLFVALIALTRVPVGAELIAISSLIVILTLIGCGVFFDRVRRNFKSETYSKTPRAEVIDISAGESLKINAFTIIAVAAVGLIYGVFAALASVSITSFLIAPIIILGCGACCFGTILIMPSAHVRVDALFESIKSRAKEKKAEGKAKPAADESAQA